MKVFSTTIAIAVLFIGVQTFAAVSWDGTDSPTAAGFSEFSSNGAMAVNTPVPGFMTQSPANPAGPHGFGLDGATEQPLERGEQLLGRQPRRVGAVAANALVPGGERCALP